MAFPLLNIHVHTHTHTYTHTLTHTHYTVLLSSFKPRGGSVLNVIIYPSDFGLPMKRWKGRQNSFTETVEMKRKALLMKVILTPWRSSGLTNSID